MSLDLRIKIHMTCNEKSKSKRKMSTPCGRVHDEEYGPRRLERFETICTDLARWYNSTQRAMHLQTLYEISESIRAASFAAPWVHEWGSPRSVVADSIPWLQKLFPPSYAFIQDLRRIRVHFWATIEFLSLTLTNICTRHHYQNLFEVVYRNITNFHGDHGREFVSYHPTSKYQITIKFQ